MASMDIHQRDDLAFPQSLPEFQRLFPDDAACAAYLGRARWPDGFVCPHCGLIAEPFRMVTRPGVLECRACRRQAGLLVGTVMERSHTPLSVWFWAAYLVASQTPGMSGDPEVAEQFMPMIHLVFSNLKTWLNGIHHGVSAKHLQAYLNEFTFRFNRRFYPFNAFRSLLGIAGGVEAPTYADLYSGAWTHPTSSGCLR